MSTEELLRAQIKELEALIALKDRRIAELEKATKPGVTFPPISVPYISYPPRPEDGPFGVKKCPNGSCVYESAGLAGSRCTKCGCYSMRAYSTS